MSKKGSSKSRKRRVGILQRDNYTCEYCGFLGTVDTLTVDHIIPLCKQGSNTVDNKVTACLLCNQSKGHRRLEPGFQAELLAKVRERNKVFYSQRINDYYSK